MHHIAHTRVHTYVLHMLTYFFTQEHICSPRLRGRMRMQMQMREELPLSLHTQEAVALSRSTDGVEESSSSHLGLLGLEAVAEVAWKKRQGFVEIASPSTSPSRPRSRAAYHGNGNIVSTPTAIKRKGAATAHQSQILTSRTARIIV